MSAFPSGSGNHISEDNLNNGTDKPKNARTDLLEAVQRINEIIDSFNANNGICGLDGQGRVSSTKLIGKIDTDQLVGDAVTGAKIEDDAVDSEHIAGGAVDFDHLSCASTNTQLGTSHTLIPTQAAVKTYVDGQSNSGLHYATTTVSDDVEESNTATGDAFVHIPEMDVTIQPQGDDSTFWIHGQVHATSDFGSTTMMLMKIRYKINAGQYNDFSLNQSPSNNNSPCHTWNEYRVASSNLYGAVAPFNVSLMTSDPNYTAASNDQITFSVFVSLPYGGDDSRKFHLNWGRANEYSSDDEVPAPTSVLSVMELPLVS